MPSQTEIRRNITSRIVEALESNLLPWRRPWTVSPNAGRPANAVTKRLYSGINPLLLELHRIRHDLRSRLWGTFRQWSEMGCTVKKRPDDVRPGQWGSSIVFCKPVTKTVQKNGEELEDKFFMLRSYTVFAADQVEGKAAEQFQVHDDEPTAGVPDYEPADQLIDATGADVRHGGDRAFYQPDDDFIQMPLKHRFDPSGGYYESILHELSHWSEPRLGWESKGRDYAFFELVAEISSCYLATELGVPQGEGLDNHAAYLKSWLKAMKNDASFIFKASTKASKVSDFLLSFVAQEQEAEQPALVGQE